MATAIDSNATNVTIDTKPMVRRRTPGAKTDVESPVVCTPLRYGVRVRTLIFESAPARNRTRNLPGRNRLLYPIELRRQTKGNSRRPHRALRASGTRVVGGTPWTVVCLPLHMVAVAQPG